MHLSRRDFLRTTAMGAPAALALSSAAPRFFDQLAAAAESRPGTEDRMLVVVQLAGGNDGLNTIVPFADDDYGRARQTLRLKPNELHKIDDQLGFHPAMQAAWQLYQDGLLGVVQGVGCPNPDQSHPRAMRIWQTADLDPTSCQTGWLGRSVQRLPLRDETDTPAVFVGHVNQPFALNTEQTVIPTLHALADFTVQDMPGASRGSAHRRQMAEAAALSRTGGNRLLDYVQHGVVNAYARSRQVELAAGGAEYPPFQLAAAFRTVAQLIRADLGIRVFYTELGGEEPGGFDNHANQRDNHASLLRQLSESLSAFVGDLRRDKLLDRVLMMTFSEFGRTVEENGRRGTDHGSAAPMFLVGGRVKGGLTGRHPSLTDLEKGGLKHHIDFRQVYATVLERWLGIDSRKVLGRQFEPLDLLSATV